MENTMANKQISQNKLYNIACKRGFNGSFAQFNEEYNDMLSKSIPTGDHLNDNGNNGAVAETVQQPVQQPVQQQQPVYQRQQTAPQETRPIERPMYPQTSLPSLKKEEGKIFGMNKWVFGGLVVVGAVVVIGGGVLIYKSMKGKSGEAAKPVAGAAATGAAATPATPAAP
ncbi:MAG: hypothetical protein AAB649_04785, partial [Patescibacteria group bacterium]